jgi:FAD binding domain
VALTLTPRIAADIDGMLKMWAETPPEEWSTAYTRGGISAPWLGIFPQLGTPARGILINRLGLRFIDESSPVHARYPRVAQAIIRQPGGFVWVIADKKIYDDSPGSEATIQKIIADGGVLGTQGNVIISNTLEEFADALSAVGVYKGPFLKTIEDYNEAVDKKTQELLQPVSRFSGNQSGGYAIRTPPFYAVPVRADSYLCFGGVRMNEHGQALDPQGLPVANLYVPPPLGGGIQNDIYMGSIGSAGVFGYLAAKHAVETLKKRTT